MTTAIEKIGYDKCTGCFGCYNVCDFNAIEMKLDKLGFYYPKIYKSKCTNCNKCYNVCPIIICNKENRDINKLKVYGAHSLDENIRKISSSGGISTELGRYILRDNGVVFGVAWNKDFLVHHIEIREEKDIFKIIGSKYIQSNVLDTYEKIYKITNEEKKKVLFIGLPCQVAALKNIVNNNNLITVDLICHGVP
ncbi:coenzyme F420 hydrogenase/dehydrogenase beta subunit N-terminal domain-containing protein [Clostridium rectalis]|uniref:coenzyme F420 hydrogenase/dehydrogenase beta subunit N-terminal domain-containing protein n=1 Tax=Clostridium rectalis TaxID=2040295 RepID=UPI000F6323DA|nr:coenzyme F420 hydrogenase/dehydrogenase beta subunit N-terminal domain-containing protein [Clostridium rectalis]